MSNKCLSGKILSEVCFYYNLPSKCEEIDKIHPPQTLPCSLLSDKNLKDCMWPNRLKSICNGSYIE